MPDSRTVLPAPKLLDFIGIRADANIILVAKTSASTARCPVCGKRSGSIHYRYTRTLADLPWQGVPVTVHLHVRRFFCDEAACEGAIFAERVPGVAARYGRRTERLDDWFTHISFALGAEAGARLLKDLGVVVSGNTLLHHIRSLHLRDRKTPRILSADDFAFRPRTRFGTVLVEEAVLYRKRFFETYPGLKRWHDNQRRAWHRGDTETRTLTGRRRSNVEKLTDHLNVPVQGTGADGLKLALALLWELRGKCPGAEPVLVCHDEVVAECNTGQAADTKAWLGRAMIEGMDTVLNGTDEVDVPIEVEARIARSWGEGG